MNIKMYSMGSRLTRFFFVLSVVILGLARCGFGEEVTLDLTGGTIIVADAPDQQIDWKTIDDKGEINQVKIQLADVKKIVLTDRPASVQIAKVRKLLGMLDSQDYYEREEAQKELALPNVGRRFKDLLEVELDNSSMEVRNRVRQIIKSFSTSNREEKTEYDYLYLNDGTFLRGDVGDLTLRCTFRGQPISLAREQLRRITKVGFVAAKQESENVQVRLLHKFDKDFFQNQERVIDFEDGAQSELKSGMDVSREFVNRGVIFEAEEKGFIGISGYPFKFPDIPAGENSVCVNDVSGSYKKRFTGVTRISFCVPGIPDAPAGVKQFGVFVSRVDNPRDFILEAYNADSQLIGCVEATDEACVFMGVESNELIAYVRILSNPYLFEVGRNIDENYALDHVWFGEPVAIADPRMVVAPNAHNTILLRSGDLIRAENLRLNEDGSVSAFEPQLKRQLRLAADEVASIRFGGEEKLVPTPNTTTQLRLPKPTSSSWRVMLSDRSVLDVVPGETFKSTLFGNAELASDQVMAIWAARDQVRFPTHEDVFEGDDAVLVFPTCRIITPVELTDESVSWVGDAKKRIQPVFTIGKPTEDVTPKYHSFRFGVRSESQMPTIWFQMPSMHDPDLGCVDLVDGQKIVLGSDSGFSLDSITEKEIVVVGKQDLRVELPLAQVLAVKFPK